jgi:hypothetical protein
MITTTTPLTMDRTVSAFYAPLERDRDHTSYVISTSTIVFEDPAMAVDYLVEYKGLSPERAERVIGRRCEFEIEHCEGLQFVTYRFRRDAE